MKKRDRDLARYAAQCYYDLKDDDCEIEIFDSFDNKIPNVGFINAIQSELPNWWTWNVGMKSKVARLSEIDFIHHINMLRAKTGSPPISPNGNLHIKWMECVVSNDPNVFLVVIKGEETKHVLVNIRVGAQSKS